MYVRLALEEEVEAIVQMGAQNALNSTPPEQYNPDKVRETFQRYLDGANPTFWVVVAENKIIGFLQAYFFGYDHRDGLFTVQKVLYVVPEKRGSRAATLLMRELIQWSAMLGADRIEGGNDNSFQSERTARFLKHFGFETVGYAMRKHLKAE